MDHDECDSELMAKIETLMDEMRAVTDAPHQTNPIIDQVLRYVLKLMGATTRRNGSDDKEYVSSLLTD